MRRVAMALLTLGLTTAACKAREVEPSASKAERPELEARGDAKQPPPSSPSQTLRAAGVELTLPGSWTVVDEDEPEFALAWGPSRVPSQVPLCTIELRRQGPGSLPEGVELGQSAGKGVTDYARGGLRGRLLELPGPTQSSTVIVHCRAPKSAQWAAIEAAFDSIVKPATAPALPPLVGGDAPIVELCAGTPARRTLVCARRRDGAVFCGPSTGEVLTRVEDIPSATQLSCEGARACVRDDEGQVSCWRAGGAAAAVPGRARDIAGDCVVSEGGELRCRRQDIDGSTTDALAELLPFGAGDRALREVERVLAGSDEDTGCVLRGGGELWCWDREGELPLALAGEREPQRVADAPAGGLDLALWGGRVCVATAEQWTCLADGQRWTLDGCERRACGCSLIGATRMSCDHEPHERIDTRVFGRVSGVVAAAGPCVARVDGTVVCRGPVSGRVGEDARTTQAVAGGLPGVAHVLELRERGD
ncbi:hypothetical protein ENSA5_32980 [Enhygromyxa salina]|uniref:Uncharacterized protein n=1 Tax=Enhygromyxa salina TaxID=215803 RepID=A0A2S9XXL2_9BACT|nr:hypothetical protein [Enhygromyxa salina]PRP97605.1 hypothetical protein ENSA5_32980 [Enhygromyxa salina]